MLALDRNTMWTTNLNRAYAFRSTYGKLVVKSYPEAFTTEQHPGHQQAAKSKGPQP